MANGTGKNSQENEIIAKTGKYSGTPALTNNRVDPEDNTSKVESFTYKHLFSIISFRVLFPGNTTKLTIFIAVTRTVHPSITPR